MKPELLIEQWDKAWDQGLGHIAWNRCVTGLTAEQAAWTPNLDRHSIWQQVNHILFWREYVLRETMGEQPETPTEEAWADTVKAFETSQAAFREAIAAGKLGFAGFQTYVAHDSYHVGEIMYIRGLQGLAVV